MKKDDVSATPTSEVLSKKDTQSAKPNTKLDQNKWEAMRETKDSSSQDDDKKNSVPKDSKDISKDSVDLKTQYEKLLAQNESLSNKVKSLEQEKTSIELYHAADLQNLRTRAAQENSTAKIKGYQQAIEAFIPLDDSLSASLNYVNGTSDQYKEGAEHILSQMQSIFDKLEVTVIAPSIGDEFDPHLHTAAGTEEGSDQKPNTIMKVFQKGYKLKERIIRPAMVVVSKAKKLENE